MSRHCYTLFIREKKNSSSVAQKMMRLIDVFLFISLFIKATKSSGFGSSSMPPTILTIQMIIDFADELRWKQVIIFDCIGSNDCTRPYAKPLVECFENKRILVTMKTLTDETELSKILRVETHRVGVILLLDDIDLNLPNNMLRKVNKMIGENNLRSTIFGDYASWLLVSTKWNSSQIFDAVRDWPIGVDSDVSVAMSFLTADVINTVFYQFSNKTCPYLRNYGHRYDYARLERSQSVAPPESIFVQDTVDPTRTLVIFYTVTVYKIRVDNNASLEAENWNTWSPSRQFTKDFRQSKLRSNLRKHVLNFGLQNSSKFYGDDEVELGENSEHTSTIETLNELIKLFEICLNATANVTNYPYHETTEAQTKETNDLVHGIGNGDIDIGAAYFDVDLERNKMIGFSFPIVRFYRSIFFKPPEMSNNIFLRPFSPKLLAYVLMTLVLVIGVMEIINYVTLSIHWQEDEEHFGLGEAALWCLSIMCAQGSPWTPKTRAGKAVLLCSLFFSLIIYNSYSGIITSILSTRSNTIKNVSDFFKYDYTFGCSRSDAEYIVTKDDLRNFYMRALESGQTKVSEKEGLERTINGSYAFFVSETVAKRLFRNSLRFERCKIEVLPRTNTQASLALPMPENSPYKKMINNGILRMWQYGVLSKLVQNIKPPLLECVRVTEYQKAHFNDVYGAFCIVGIGAVSSLLLFFFERAWINRKRIRAIRRRIAGKPIVQTNPAVLNALRLPMRIIGLQDGKDLMAAKGIKDSELKLSKLRNVNRDLFRNVDQTPFPYCP